MGVPGQGGSTQRALCRELTSPRTKLAYSAAQAQLVSAACEMGAAAAHRLKKSQQGMGAQPGMLYMSLQPVQVINQAWQAPQGFHLLALMALLNLAQVKER